MKALKLAFIILLVLSVTSILYAETKVNFTTDNKGNGSWAPSVRPAGAKLERGMKNILYGWTEIPKAVIQVTRDSKNPFWGLTGGVIKGLGKAYPRTVSGAVDAATFAFEDYDKMIVKPDPVDTGIR